MKETTSEWFTRLTQVERKAVVSMLFAVRCMAPILYNERKRLFSELINRLDDEHHALKNL